MRRRFLFLFAAILVEGALCAGEVPAPPPGPATEFQIGATKFTAHLERWQSVDPVIVGEPMFLMFVLNAPEGVALPVKVLPIETGGLARPVSVKVARKGGGALPSRLGMAPFDSEKLAESGPRALTLSKWQYPRVRILLPEWVRFEEPGIYEVTAEMRIAAADATDATPVVVRATIDLPIQRYDEALMNAFIDSYASSAFILLETETGRFFGDSIQVAWAWNAVHLLAAIENPRILSTVGSIYVSAPYMMGNFASPGVMSVAAGGLARLETDDAVQILARAATEPVRSAGSKYADEYHASARAALGRMKNPKAAEALKTLKQ